MGASGPLKRCAKSNAKNMINKVKASVSSFLASVKEAFALPELAFA